MNLTNATKSLFVKKYVCILIILLSQWPMKDKNYLQTLGNLNDYRKKKKSYSMKSDLNLITLAKYL